MNKNKKIIWLGFCYFAFFFLIFVFTKDIGQNKFYFFPFYSSPDEKTAQAFLEINEERLETTIGGKKMFMIL